MKLLAAAALLFAAPLAGHAQLGLYAAYTSASLSTADTSRINGGTFGVQYDGSHHVLANFGVDVRGTVLSSDGSKTTTVLAGPRIVLHLPVIPLQAYGEGLVGGTFVNVGQGSALTDTSGVAGGIAVGGDLHLLPLISWRVVDYSYTYLQPSGTRQSSISTGILLRIPFTR